MYVYEGYALCIITFQCGITFHDHAFPIPSDIRKTSKTGSHHRSENRPYILALSLKRMNTQTTGTKRNQNSLQSKPATCVTFWSRSNYYTLERTGHVQHTKQGAYHRLSENKWLLFTLFQTTELSKHQPGVTYSYLVCFSRSQHIGCVTLCFLRVDFLKHILKLHVLHSIRITYFGSPGNKIKEERLAP